MQYQLPESALEDGLDTFELSLRGYGSKFQLEGGKLSIVGGNCPEDLSDLLLNRYGHIIAPMLARRITESN